MNDTAKGARRAANAMDAVLVIVAALTMAFSLGNIHAFALRHGTADPIAYFLAPAVDLALIGALIGDAFLSRHGLSGGRWAACLRYFAGAATLALNTWEAIVARDFAAVVLHAVPPVLLFALAEAATPYRQAFAAVVRAAEQVDTAPVQVHAEPVQVPVQAAVQVNTAPPAIETAPEPSPLVICGGQQVYSPEVPPAPEPVRLGTAEAKAAILQAWKDGLSLADAARVATRSRSYVQQVYARLDAERGPQPAPGQMALAAVAA